MASYDSEGIKIQGGGYILEKGEYTISLRSDSHTVFAEESFEVEEDIDYSKDGRSSDLTPATNQFEDYPKETSYSFPVKTDLKTTRKPAAKWTRPFIPCPTRPAKL